MWLVAPFSPISQQLLDCLDLFNQSKKLGSSPLFFPFLKGIKIVSSICFMGLGAPVNLDHNLR